MCVIFADFELTSSEYPYRSESAPLCVLTQREGELLYVPRHFSHQVLNVGRETTGFAVEIDNYVF